MRFIAKLYYLVHTLTSKPEERGEYSVGHWQSQVRIEVFNLCKKINGRVVEIGCGEGLFLVKLAQCHNGLEIWGLDNNRKILSQLKDKSLQEGFANMHFVLGEAGYLPFSDECFDTVICINTSINMPSIDYLKMALSEMMRICKKGGKIIFEYRNSLNKLLNLKYRLARYYDETLGPLPLNTFSTEMINSFIKSANFRVLNRRFIPKFFEHHWLRAFSPIIIVEAIKEC
ncbi:MAG: class I SAM-dependent methyltransferase [Candidatus Omnitrophica bacterium]|nr:class I SAM-dependent methyltransferase [Candidatus Omnitrophota bacterium]